MNIEEQLMILLNVFIACMLTGLIGLEREKYDKPAGFRTSMLIGGGVALLTSLGKVIIIDFYNYFPADLIDADPTRIIQAIVVGISFIGAGTVLQLKTELEIKYLTTAASTIFSAGIGISIALEQYILGVGSTLLVLFIMYIVRVLKERFQ
ncbi:MAG: MgtC/SapB family protein [Bacteroidota bacterium]